VVRTLFAAGAAVALYPWYSGATHFEGAANLITSFGRTAGLLAVYLCLTQLLLMARIPWLERAIGFDRLAAWHRGIGMSTVLLIAAHAALIFWGYSLTSERDFVGEGWNVITTYPAMIRGTIAGAILVAVAVTSARWARRRLPYEAWWLLHLSAYVAVVLAFAHQVESGDQFVGHEVATNLLRAAYLAVFAAVIWWRIVVPLRNAYAHRTVVESVVAESPRAASIYIRGEALRDLDARAGQYVLLRFLTPGLWLTAHPYSLSAPAEDGRLRVTVQDDGDHSAATLRVAPGCRVIAEGPFGTFTAERARHHAPALLIGGGSGIAPLRAIAEDLSEAGRDVVVIQRARSDSEQLLGGELRAAAAAGRITLHQITGSRSVLGYAPLAPTELHKLVGDVYRRDVWICGPARMITAAVASCRALGVADADIHFEEYDW
jgi:predicted ferric reductase